MNVLLMRLCGPMQSWGVQSRFSIRDTGLEPSKSGVVGILCAALGRPREARIDDLASLVMGVRADREGHLAYDFHTAQNVRKASGGIKDTEPSRRYYLADGCFLAGLESHDLELLERLHAALRNPVWPLYLGRKAFVPGDPVWLPDGLRVGVSLYEALRSYRLLRDVRSDQGSRLRMVIEDPAGGELRPDQPLSFRKGQRRFSVRRVRTEFAAVADPIPSSSGWR